MTIIQSNIINGDNIVGGLMPNVDDKVIQNALDKEKKKKPTTPQPKKKPKNHNPYPTQSKGEVVGDRIIALMSEDEYAALSEDAKKQFVVYNPKEVNDEIKASLVKATVQMEILEKLGPAFCQLLGLPRPFPGIYLTKFFKIIGIIVELMDPIIALTEDGIIGKLAKPLVDILNEVLQLFGSLLAIIWCLAQGKELFTDTVVKTVEHIDWNGLGELFNDDSPSVDNAYFDAAVDAIPFSEIKEPMRVLVDAAKNTDVLVDEVKGAVEGFKILTETTLKKFTWQYFKDNIFSMETLSRIGLDTSPLERPTEEDKTRFKAAFPDPVATSQQINSAINKLTQEKKYIYVPDNEYLIAHEKEKAEDEQAKVLLKKWRAQEEKSKEQMNSVNLAHPDFQKPINPVPTPIPSVPPLTDILKK